MTVLRQVYAISRNTVLELIRQPFYALLLVASCALIVLTPATAAHIYSFRVSADFENVAQRMIADLGLATLLMFGLFLAVFSSTSSISQEIEARTAAMVLSKSVGRSTFLTGKFCGIVVSLGTAIITGSIVVLLTIRASPTAATVRSVDWNIVLAMLAAVILAIAFATWRSYVAGKSWVGCFVLGLTVSILAVFVAFFFASKGSFLQVVPEPTAEIGPDELLVYWTAYDFEVARAATLMFLAIVVVASIAVATSTRLGVVGTACVTGVFVLLGLVSEFVHNTLREREWGALFDFAAEVIYTVVPNLEKFWMSDALTHDQHIPDEYILVATAYAAIYVLAALLVAAALLQRREVR